MTATFLVGDVRQRMAELKDGSFDLILCSPPFLALRSYLPDGHPDKHLEIGSEATPAEFLDVMLELTAEWGRLLAPHGSIAIELGDTYAGSGGAGGDYNPDGLRAGQPTFRQDFVGDRKRKMDDRKRTFRSQPRDGYTGGGPGWPPAKSLVCVPQLYQIALAYGINPLTGQPSPAGRWRVRNLKSWVRSNPPVGALGDKERPATSYIIVACRATDRWFDLDAVRVTPTRPRDGTVRHKVYDDNIDSNVHRGFRISEGFEANNPGGAPPRDWVHTVDLILDTELANRAGKYNGGRNPEGKPITEADTRRLDAASSGSVGHGNRYSEGDRTQGAQGVHLRRALEHAGILTPQDFYDISPKGYRGAHYAVWPPELARRLIDEMCPRHVCTQCGEPRRRLVETEGYVDANGKPVKPHVWTSGIKAGQGAHSAKTQDPSGTTRVVSTVGWSDCGCEHCTCDGHDHRGAVTRCKFCPCDLADHWRPGRVLDPFVGSGTTLAVATGMARDSVGIDLDARNATLAYQRVGMFLTVDGPMDEPDLTPTPPDALEPVVDVIESL